MPLYEYQCEACTQRFERIQKFSDPPVETCPSCGGRVRKLLSSPAIQFKGSGWYITDYARKSSRDGAKGDATKTDADSKTDTAKSDASTTSSETGSAATASTSKTETKPST